MAYSCLERYHWWKRSSNALDRICLVCGAHAPCLGQPAVEYEYNGTTVRQEAVARTDYDCRQDGHWCDPTVGVGFVDERRPPECVYCGQTAA
jgi:hypothetical protein